MYLRSQLLKIIFTAFILMPIQLLSQNIEDVVLSDESNLSINGTSNVNDFSCVLEQEFSQDTLSFGYKFEQNSILIEGDILKLDAEKFNCGKRGINRDFRRTLEVKKYPFINISLKKLFVSTWKAFPNEALVDIEIAGIVREYVVSLTKIGDTENSVRIRGEKTLNISDFNLEPPTALFGLVKVREEMDIYFNLVIMQNL